MSTIGSAALGARVELARRHLYDYCRLKNPQFYRSDRVYLKEIADRMEDFFLYSKKHFLVLTVPPRFGKSLTAQGGTEWLFGRFGVDAKVGTGSYNERLSSLFARSVRNTIQTEKADENVVYSDIFPGISVKYGEASANLWALDGSKTPNYLATSPGGTATGIGLTHLFIDDVIKSAEEAYNDNVLEDIWEWFTNTMMQRMEGSNYKIVIIMTRWANGDLAGRVIEAYGDDVEHISFSAVQDDGSMLCDSILSRSDYETKTKEMNADIVEANYNQKPIDVKGRLYSGFKEWEEKPDGKIINFTDTADKGDDFLCSIDGIISEDEFYVTNVVFTDEAMEVTEPLVADMLYDDGVTEANIESNNGGRGFARNVERELKDRYGSNRCTINQNPQTKNKESRILANSTWVQNHIYMPKGWAQRFPEFYKNVMAYQRKGRNAHDDGPDVLSSVSEYIVEDKRPQFLDEVNDTRREDRVLRRLRR